MDKVKDYFYDTKMQNRGKIIKKNIYRIDQKNSKPYLLLEGVSICIHFMDDFIFYSRHQESSILRIYSIIDEVEIATSNLEIDNFDQHVLI